MLKRGQVSIFVIIGVAVLAIFFLVFYFRSEIIYNFVPASDVEKELNVKMQSFSQHVGECIEKEGNNVLKMIGENGGILNPVNTLEYKNKSWIVLCTKVSEEKYCVRNVISKGDIAILINTYLDKTIKQCIDISLYISDPDFTLSTGQMNVNTTIGQKAIIINLDYPVEMQKGNITKEKEKFTKIFEVALADVIDMANDVLEGEAKGGFTTAGYTPVLLNDYTIKSETFLNNRFITVIDSKSDFEFKFACEREK